MKISGVWKSARSGKTVMVVNEQHGAMFSGHYFTSAGAVPEGVAFPVVGFVTQVGQEIRRIAWVVCWDFLDQNRTDRAHFSSVTGWAGALVPSLAGRAATIDALWLLSGDPASGFRAGDDGEWASIRAGGEAVLTLSNEVPEAVAPAEPIAPLKRANVIGRWQNDLGSCLEVTKQVGSYFEGKYDTPVGAIAGHGPFPVVGHVTQLGHPAYSRIAFTVCYDDERAVPARSSVALFCGRLASAATSPNQRETIDALWILSQDPGPPPPEAPPEPDGGEWRSKRVGRNVFQRV